MFRRRKKGQYQNLSTLHLKDGEKRIVQFKDLSFPIALIKKVFKNEDKSVGTLYLATNDLESSVDRIYEIYQKLWHPQCSRNSTFNASEYPGISQINQAKR